MTPTPDADYQKVFYEFTNTLDQVALGRLCVSHDLQVPLFLAWTATCPVRHAKMQEVTETRLKFMEKAK